MDLSHIPLFEALSKRMAWLSERQVVLAQNVANGSTPGYQPEDLKEPDFGSILAGTGGAGGAGRLPMTISAPGQLSASTTAGAFEHVKAGGRNLDGDGGIEKMALKVSQNASDFSLMETLYRAQMGLIKTALGANNGS